MTNEEAVKMLRTMQRTVYLGNRKFEDAIECAIKALSEPLQPWEVLAAQAVLSHPEPHWIPVTERLPEDSVYVLLTIRRMDVSYNHVPFISTGYISWNHQCWWCAHDGNCKDANIDVLAWMPLPEPYKGVTT